MLHSLRKRAADIGRDEEGLAYLEFALCIGLLLIMFFGAIEITRYILIIQKVEKTVDTLTDVITQAEPKTLTNTDISQYLNAAPQLMSPYGLGANGNIILTDLSTGSAPTPITMNWQVCGGGTLAATSQITGSPGGTATLPTSLGSYTMNANEEIVVGEIFYNYTPMLTQNILPISPSQIYRVAIFKPRYGTGVQGPQTSNACP